MYHMFTFGNARAKFNHLMTTNLPGTLSAPLEIRTLRQHDLSDHNRGRVCMGLVEAFCERSGMQQSKIICEMYQPQLIDAVEAPLKLSAWDWERSSKLGSIAAILVSVLVKDRI